MKKVEKMKVEKKSRVAKILVYGLLLGNELFSEFSSKKF